MQRYDFVDILIKYIEYLLLRAQCTSCGDPISRSPFMKGPCGHDYCAACVSDLVNACTRDESLYPPRCCGQPFSQEAIIPFLSAKLLATYNMKRMELDIPAASRLYCPNSTCSTFLGSSESVRSDIRCRKCGTSTCPRCKQTSHVGYDCVENQSTNQVRELARAQGWQTCPGCNAIVELNTGCYHITCRCRHQFCYVCARTWKDCSCPQWDESHLLVTAQQRVQQENAGRARVAPLFFQQQVRQMANALRDNHGCVQHSWRRRNGSATCEECGHWLRDFLLVRNEYDDNAEVMLKPGTELQALPLDGVCALCTQPVVILFVLSPRFCYIKRNKNTYLCTNLPSEQALCLELLK